MNAGRAAVDHDGSHDEGDGDDADFSAAPASEDTAVPGTEGRPTAEGPRKRDEDRPGPNEGPGRPF
jgi:hypothetical protein